MPSLIASVPQAFPFFVLSSLSDRISSLFFVTGIGLSYPGAVRNRSGIGFRSPTGGYRFIYVCLIVATVLNPTSARSEGPSRA